MLKHQKISILVFMALTLLMCGCASNMSMNNETQIDIEKKSLVLMSLKISNQYKPNYQPRVFYISIIDSEKAWQISQEAKKLDELDIDKSTFEYSAEDPSSNILIRPGKADNILHHQYNQYLIHFQLPPGNYKLGQVVGCGSSFLISGKFNFPINAKFTVPKNSIVYIGDLEMVNQERKDGERRSGSMFPLVDQAVSGFYGGTFKLNIFDRYDEDIDLFKKKYPFTKDYNVIKFKAILDEKTE